MSCSSTGKYSLSLRCCLHVNNNTPAARYYGTYVYVHLYGEAEATNELMHIYTTDILIYSREIAAGLTREHGFHMGLLLWVTEPMLGKCPISWGEDVYRYWQYRYNLKKVRLRLIMRFTAGYTGTFMVPVHGCTGTSNQGNYGVSTRGISTRVLWYR